MSKSGAIRQSFHFQFITTPTSDTPGTALFLHFNDQRYLFGQVAEGTQRACIQRGIGLKKVHNVFLTGVTDWRTNGGLIGMILTMADIQSAQLDTGLPRRRLNIHGGPKITHTIASARRFVFRTGMPLDMHEYNPRVVPADNRPSWSDDNIQVWALPARKLHGDRGSLSSSGCEQTTSISDFSSDEDDDTEPDYVSEEYRLAQRQRNAIVNDMFDSGWQKDCLVEKPFGEVRLPALIWVRDPETKTLTTIRCESAASAPDLPLETKVLVRYPWPASLVSKLPPTEQARRDVTMSYIVKGYAQRGRFDATKALELGVPKGPLWGHLTNGINVQLEDGATVTPEMVLGPGKPGRGLAIVDLPNRLYLSDLLRRPEWRSEIVMEGVEFVIWILGPSLQLTDPGLEAFMRSLAHVKHIVSSATTCPDYFALESSAASAVRLSKVWKDVFPVPVRNIVEMPQTGITVEPLQASMTAGNIYVPAERGLQLRIEPRTEMSWSEVKGYLDTAEVIRKIPANVHELVVQATTAGVEQGQQQLQQEPEIITLGTGSASPSKYRNVSATLVRIPGSGSYLFDCGENTLGQLGRLYTSQELIDVLLDIRFIWISHLHGDHHLGTVSVIAAQRKAWRRKGTLAGVSSSEPSLIVASEAGMIGFLEDYGSVENVSHVKKVVADPIEGLQVNGEPYSFVTDAVPITELRTCKVSHCKGAQAVSVTFDTGFKFSYSGDCRPSAEFVEIGSQSDVLVHEATFDDGLEGDAFAKKHCTTGEALAVAAKMGAKNVILTHFSQRYQKIPVLSDVKLPKSVRFEEAPSDSGDVDGPVDTVSQTEPVQVKPEAPEEPGTASIQPPDEQASPAGETLALDMNIAVAFDYMKIRVTQIKDFHKYTPALRALFEVETASDDQVTVDIERDKDDDADRNAQRHLERNVNRVKDKSTAPESQKRKEGSGEGSKDRGREKRKKHLTGNDINSQLGQIQKERVRIKHNLRRLRQAVELEWLKDRQREKHLANILHSDQEDGANLAPSEST